MVRAVSFFVIVSLSNTHTADIKQSNFRALLTRLALVPHTATVSVTQMPAALTPVAAAESPATGDDQAGPAPADEPSAAAADAVPLLPAVEAAAAAAADTLGMARADVVDAADVEVGAVFSDSPPAPMHDAAFIWDAAQDAGQLPVLVLPESPPFGAGDAGGEPAPFVLGTDGHDTDTK
jgi:hypothetical protein